MRSVLGNRGAEAKRQESKRSRNAKSVEAWGQQPNTKAGKTSILPPGRVNGGISRRSHGGRRSPAPHAHTKPHTKGRRLASKAHHDKHVDEKRQQQEQEQMQRHAEALQAANALQADYVDGEVQMPHRVDASALTQHEVMKLLEAQGTMPSGFHAEDCANLQKMLDADYDAKLEMYEKVIAKASEQARQATIEKQRARGAMREKLEEDLALRKRPDIVAWLHKVKAGEASAFSHFSVRGSIARYIAKSLPSDCCLRSLSLMRNNLNDEAGQAFGALLRRTTSLRQLNLGENRLGPKTLTAIGEGLSKNHSLQSIGLEHNDLTKGATDFSGAESLAKVRLALSVLVTVGVVSWC